MPSVYPACAGIDPPYSQPSPWRLCLPRMRGDRPKTLFNNFNFSLFTPHARGSTLFPTCFIGTHTVYPACAGIDPSGEDRQSRNSCLPRMRGDRPEPHLDRLDELLFTPHARGSTRRRLAPRSL